MWKSFSAVLAAGICVGCDLNGSSPKPQAVAFDRLSGIAEKGPLSQGSKVVLYELDGSLNPTGKVYSTNTLSDRGDFAFSRVSLASPYAKLEADGYYFDEVAGKLSSGPITLQGIVSLGGDGPLNLNVLTHLQADRTLALVRAGTPFAEAREIAAGELRKAFGGADSGTAAFESLEMGLESSQAAWLLSMSSLLVSHRSPAELTALLSRVRIDFADDGRLQDSSLKAELANGARFLDLAAIRKHCAAFYKKPETAFDPVALQDHLDRFDSSMGPGPRQSIVYPKECAHGENLLNAKEPFLLRDSVLDEKTGKYEVDWTYSFCADLPPGATLQVSIHGAPWWHPPSQGDTGWDLSMFYDDYRAVLTSSRSGRLDIKIGLMRDYYYPDAVLVMEGMEGPKGTAFRRTLSW